MDETLLKTLANWSQNWEEIQPLEERIAEVWKELKALRVKVKSREAALVEETAWLSEFEARFWSKVEIVDDEESCWPWKRSRHPVPGEEYGIFRVGASAPFGLKEGVTRASRVALTLALGHLPDHTRHKCDNPPCCRPSHLEDGTHADNMRDRKERGRYGGWTRKEQRGEANDSAVLTETIVLDARRRSKAGETQRAIATLHGVDVPTLAYAIRGQTWSHLDDVEAPHIRRVGGGSQLTEDDIRAIRAEAAQDSLKTVAARRGMKYHTVYAIISRRSWAHVE